MGVVLRSVYLALVLHIACLPAHGVTRTWDAGGDTSDWDENANWSDNQQPGGGDDAVIFFGTPLVTTSELIRNLTVAAIADINVQGTLNANGGTVHNDGVITIDHGAAQGPSAFVIGIGTLGGTGELVLADSDFGNTGAALTGPAIGVTTHSAGHTIRGEGSMSGHWINDGLIRAEDTSGDATAVLRFFGGHMLNNGVIRSSATGALLLYGMNFTLGAGGQFIADTGPIYLSTGTINSGTLASANGGTYEMVPFGSITLNGATIEASINMTSGGSINSSSGLINNGVVTLDLAQVIFTSPGTIDGTGELVLNRESADTRIGGFTTITNGAMHTIRGAGRIQPQVLINNGSVIADPKNGNVLTLLAPTTNNNLLQAGSGGVLNLAGSIITQDNAIGRIRSASGGMVFLLSTSVNGGRFETDGTGTIDAAGQAILTNVTNNGTYQGHVGSLTCISGTSLTNNGVITINSDNLPGGTELQFDSNATLQGTGMLVLNRAGTDSRFETNAGITATQAAGHTIRGKGQINGSLVNHGRLEGFSAAEFLEINAVVSGDGVMKDVRIDGFHIAGAFGGTAIVPLQGAYTISSAARLLIDLAGTTPGTGHDQLNSTGTMNFNAGSRLEVSVLDGFVPTAGNSFVIATSTSPITGTFSTTVLPAHIPNYALTWEPVHYNGNNITLTLQSITALTGDYNANGIVDAADYPVWRNSLGRTGTNLAADGNGDNMVTILDYDLWKSRLGQTSGSGAAASVPEPATICLLFGVLGWIAAPRRRSQCSMVAMDRRGGTEIQK